MFLYCVIRGTNQGGIAAVTFYAGVLVIPGFNRSWDTGCPVAGTLAVLNEDFHDFPIPSK